MKIEFIVNHGYLSEPGIIAAVAKDLLTEAERAQLKGAGARLDRLWSEISATCPRQVAEQRAQAKAAALAAPGDARALAELHRLESESPVFVGARHDRAHALFNAEVWKLAPLARTALVRFKEAILARATRAAELVQAIRDLFPASIDDLHLAEVLEARCANTLRGLDQRIATLQNPEGSAGHIELFNLGQLDIAPDTRQTAGSSFIG